MLAAQADRLDQLAQRLVETKPLVAARDAIAAIHALPSWKRARTKATDYKPLEPHRLDEVMATLAQAATPIRQASSTLRTGRVADAITMFDATVTSLYSNALHDLSSDLVDELVFDREDPCKHASCDGLAAIDAGYKLAAELQPEVRRVLVDAGHELATALGSSLDVHTRTVLTRATGEGPAFGEPCGPEGLCRWDQACMDETHTCEHACSELAEQPCPADGGACVKVASLPQMYCRRR